MRICFRKRKARRQILIIFTLTILKKINYYIALISAIVYSGCEKEETEPAEIKLLQVFVGQTEINLSGPISENLPVDRSITLVFSAPLQASSTQGVALRTEEETAATVSTTLLDKSIAIHPDGVLQPNTVYVIEATAEIKGEDDQSFAPVLVRFKTAPAQIALTAVKIGGKDASAGGRIIGVPRDLLMEFTFSSPVSVDAFKEAFSLTGPDATKLSFTLSDDEKTIRIVSEAPLAYLRKYAVSISGSGEINFPDFSINFYTDTDPAPKFPEISDEALLTLVQRQTFGYFWDFAHPHSGLARERNTSGDVVTTGGSGFGVMAILVGIERNFITREVGMERLSKIVDFLATSDRFHGVWPHWLHGETGKTIPFSEKDDGGDLVETALMMQGLLSVRAYLDETIAVEKSLYDKITQLWEEVEWSWYTRGGRQTLYWHWSPNYEWEMNLPIRGYNEALIAYVLAAASPSHPIDKETYDNGWAQNGNIINGQTYFGYRLPVGFEYGGPLFFAHYSFLGLDPRELSDQYANYWEQNKNHALINREYCAANPKNYAGYSGACWGLTASDNHQGYSAHSPANDLGVISPTAALSSMPYTPEESMDALRFFYYTIGDRLWGEYGFYDAFNPTEEWYADSYLAIDQGPVILMIENSRTSLLWNLFMSDKEIQGGLDKLGFNY